MNISDDYIVEFTEECTKEIKKIYEYIKYNFYLENTASSIMIEIEEKVNNLKRYPKMYNEVDKYKDMYRKYRKIVVKNYILLYTIDENNKKIYISHMYYGGSNYLNKI